MVHESLQQGNKFSPLNRLLGSYRMHSGHPLVQNA